MSTKAITFTALFAVLSLWMGAYSISGGLISLVIVAAINAFIAFWLTNELSRIAQACKNVFARTNN